MSQTLVSDTTNFSTYLDKALKTIWILFLIYVVVDFGSNFFYPENKELFAAKVLGYASSALSVFFFSWYFIINKRTKSLLFVIPVLVLFFVFRDDIENLADYYLPFEPYINSKTLGRFIYIFLQIMVCFVLSKRFAVEESSDVAFWTIFLLNFGLLSLFGRNIGFVESMVNAASYSSKTLEFFATLIYYILSSAKDIAILGFFYFLLGCVIKKENIYTFSGNILKYVNTNYTRMTVIFISCGIFLFLNLLQSSVSLEMDYFGKDLTIFGWLNAIFSCVAFVVVCRLIGQFLGFRSQAKQKYYGVVGGTFWIPLLNIISWLMVKYDEKLNFLSPKNFKKARITHLVIGTLIIAFFYRKGLLEFETETIFYFLVYSGALWFIAFQKKFYWWYAAVLAVVVILIKVYPFVSDFYETDFVFKDYFLDFVRQTFSIALIQMVIVFYGIFYIAHQSYKEKESALFFA